MNDIVRMTEIPFRAVFNPSPGYVGNPASARMRFTYINLTGQLQNDDVDMTKQADSSFTCSWSSENCKGGEVEWVAYCWGGLKASQQGSFRVRVNKASAKV